MAVFPYLFDFQSIKAIPLIPMNLLILFLAKISITVEFSKNRISNLLMNIYITRKVEKDRICRTVLYIVTAFDNIWASSKD